MSARASLRFLVAAGLLAGCAPDTGFALDLDITPGCAPDTIDSMTVTASLTPSGLEALQTVSAPIFTGGHRHVVILPKDGTTEITVSVVALRGGISIAEASINVPVSGHQVVDASLSLSGCTDGGVDSKPAATLKSINVTPTNPVLPVGAKLQLKATGTYSDNSIADLTTKATWASNSPTTASITAGGMVKALKSGQGAASITAVLDGVTGSDALEVSAATLKTIMISPANGSVGVGSTLQLSATGIYSDNTSADLTSSVTWGASNGDATVGATGLATGKVQGMTMVSAMLDGITATANLTVTAAMLSSITITPAKPSLASGTNQQMAATGNYDDNSTQDLTAQVTWASDDPMVATVSAAGLVHAVGVGSANITATLGKVGTTSVSVTAPLLMTLVVAPAMTTLAAGTTGNFTATGNYSDGSNQDLTASATWTSSNMMAASVSNANGSQGLVSALAPGAADIVATFMGIMGTGKLTVGAATLMTITVTPANTTLHSQTSQQLTATGNYSDNTMQDLTTQVTWSSSDPVVVVSNLANSNGLATVQTAMANVAVTITATRSGINGTAVINVDATALTSINITPKNSDVAAGLKEQLTAMGQYGANMQDITKDVAWATGSAQVATISNSPGTHGLLTGIAVGQTQVVAALSKINGNTNVTVGAAILVALQLSPISTTISVGNQVPYKATAVMSDNTTFTVTKLTTFASSDNSVANFLNANLTPGVATGVKPGMVTITGSYGGKMGTAMLTVIP